MVTLGTAKHPHADHQEPQLMLYLITLWRFTQGKATQMGQSSKFISKLVPAAWPKGVAELKSNDFEKK